MGPIKYGGDVICGSDRSFFLCCLVIANAASLGVSGRQIPEEGFKVEVVNEGRCEVPFSDDGMKLLPLPARYSAMVHCTFWALVSGSCYHIIESGRELSEHRWRLRGGGVPSGVGGHKRVRKSGSTGSGWMSSYPSC